MKSSTNTRRRRGIAGWAELLVGAVLLMGSMQSSRAQDGWTMHAGNPHHTALSSVAAQNLEMIHWTTPVDLSPPSGEILIHYGSPLVTPNNTVIVPVKTGSSGGFMVKAFKGGDGSLIWSQTTDYVLPAHNWTPSYAPCLAPGNRLYFAGAGGTIYYRDNVDSAAGATGQLAFFGMANYNASPGSYNATVFINTPITCDTAGNIYFGFRTSGTAPLGLVSGIARIDAAGNGSWVSAVNASGGDPTIVNVPHQAAPVLSNDEQTLYAVVSAGSTARHYLVGLDPATLAIKSSSPGVLMRVPLMDPRNNGANNCWLIDDSSATPMVGPDGDVYYGVLGNPNNGSRGWMLHFSGDLTQTKTPGAFGWDNTASVVPVSMVPSYTGNSSYLIFTKYNNYAGLDGGDGVNKVAILDPNATQVESHTSSNGLLVMKEVLTIAGQTPDPEHDSTYPNAVREWCINTAAVDPITKCVLVNSEDGKLYRWDLTTNSFTQIVTLSAGVGEAYTPTAIGPDGTVYAINFAVLNAVGARPATSLAVPDVAGYAGGSVTLSARLTATADGSPIASQPIAFQVGGTNVGTATTDADGIASLPYTIPAGTPLGSLQIACAFAGNSTLAPSAGAGTLYVRRKATLIAANVSGAVDSAVTLKATLKSAGVALPGRTVHFLIDGTAMGSATTSSTGVAALTHTLTEAVGTHQITAVFDGDADYAPVTSAAATLTVKLIQPALSVTTVTASPSQTANLTATLKAGSTALGGQTVSFAIDGTGVGSATTDSTGKAVLAHVVNESLGSHTITAQYAGNGVKYGPATGTGTLKVLAKTKIRPDVVKAPAGSTVQYGAKLLRSDTLASLEGETLSFYAGTTLIGTAVTDASGRATVTVTAPAAGVKQSITVKFAGDAQYKASSATGSVTGT